MLKWHLFYWVVILLLLLFFKNNSSNTSLENKIIEYKIDSVKVEKKVYIPLEKVDTVKINDTIQVIKKDTFYYPFEFKKYTYEDKNILIRFDAVFFDPFSLYYKIKVKNNFANNFLVNISYFYGNELILTFTKNSNFINPSISIGYNLLTQKYTFGIGLTLKF